MICIQEGLGEKERREHSVKYFEETFLPAGWNAAILYLGRL
jgi:hypothetical protein